MKKLTDILFLLLLVACSPYPQTSNLASMDELVYPYETQYIDLQDGIKLAYVEEGSGQETLLFLHGLGSYLPAWQKNVEELKTNYRCIAIDLPGYGKSSKGKYAYDMRFFADVVAAFIAQKSLEEVVLVGHSMGGQIAVTLGLYYPELVNKLVLVSPAGFETFHEGQKQWFRDVFTARLVQLTPVEAIQSNLAYNFYELPDDANFMITDRIAMRTASDFEWYCHAVSMSVKGMVDQPVYEYLKDLDKEVLVLFGENDNLIPNRFLNPGFTRTIAESGMSQLKNAQLEMLPKTGHFAQFEAFQQVNAEIRAFVGD